MASFTVDGTQLFEPHVHQAQSAALSLTILNHFRVLICTQFLLRTVIHRNAAIRKLSIYIEMYI